MLAVNLWMSALQDYYLCALLQKCLLVYCSTFIITYSDKCEQIFVVIKTFVKPLKVVGKPSNVKYHISLCTIRDILLFK